MARAQKWKKLSSRNLLDDQRLKVDEDTVELPNGKVTTYVHIPSTNDSVIIIAINTKQKILLQREYSYPPNEIMWQLPGGSMEAGEEIEEAAQRELSEESGYAAKEVKLLGYFYTSNRRSNKKQFIVVCKDLYNRKLAADEDEFIDTHWIAYDEIKRMIQRQEFTNINLLAALNVWLHSTE